MTQQNKTGKRFGPPPERGPKPQGMKKGGFDPEGSGYDYKRAKELDYKRDDKGHLPTRDYKTGMILKGKKHESFSKGVQEDFKKGYQLKKKGDRYYTIKSKREFNKLREKASLPHVSQSLKVGGITGCPHRENGVKSDIKGISDIQVKGKKFIVIVTGKLFLLIC